MRTLIYKGKEAGQFQNEEQGLLEIEKIVKNAIKEGKEIIKNDPGYDINGERLYLCILDA